MSFRTSSALLCGLALLLAACATAQEDPATDRALPGFATNTAKRAIDLSELRAGGPPKDGIPSVDDPVFIAPDEAAAWLEPQEPVVALALEGEARAYPLQILTWHEIVNDEVGGTPVAVTFCPLCYSAVAFDRRVEGQVLTFGVSGLLRFSDLVMFDRETETLWQQLTGEALVGDLLGAQLAVHPAQIVSFEQFRTAYPGGVVLSRDTGHARDYGRNPYAGYDDIDRQPYLYDGPTDGRLRPMEKVIALKLDGAEKAYPYSLTREQRVVNDEAETAGGPVPLVVLHADGAVSALDAARIADSKGAGSTGVFDRRAETPDGVRTLTFRFADGHFEDEETASRWGITGRAVSGPLEGTQLTRLPHGDYFAFAWFAFKPEAEVYTDSR